MKGTLFEPEKWKPDPRYRNPGYPAAYHAAHKAERNAYAREAHFRRRYGLTTEAYAALLASQFGFCAACGSDNPRTRHGRFHVDHKHEPGQLGGPPRGLLCAPCNLAIGFAKEDPMRLRRCATYIEEHS